MTYRRREAAAARARVRGGGEAGAEAVEASAQSEQGAPAADSRDPLNELMTTDQLTRERALGHAFGGFTEARPSHQCDVSRRRVLLTRLAAQGAITFPPTFKFDKGHKATQTDQCVCALRAHRRRNRHPRTILRYDSSSKQRVPAWTDRILFKPTMRSSTTGWAFPRVELTSYDSMRDARHSDHRPVVARFELDLRAESSSSEDANENETDGDGQRDESAEADDLPNGDSDSEAR